MKCCLSVVFVYNLCSVSVCKIPFPTGIEGELKLEDTEEANQLLRRIRRRVGFGIRGSSVAWSHWSHIYLDIHTSSLKRQGIHHYHRHRHITGDGVGGGMGGI